MDFNVIGLEFQFHQCSFRKGFRYHNISSNKNRTYIHNCSVSLNPIWLSFHSLTQQEQWKPHARATVSPIRFTFGLCNSIGSKWFEYMINPQEYKRIRIEMHTGRCTCHNGRYQWKRLTEHAKVKALILCSTATMLNHWTGNGKWGNKTLVVRVCVCKSNTMHEISAYWLHLTMECL